MSASTPRNEAVILVHGLWLSGWSMGLVAWRMRRRGYDVHCFSYPTARRDIRDNAAALARFAVAIDRPELHFIGFSFGGLVIQTLLQHFPPARPGRVVTVGSPHQGAEVARTLARYGFGRWMLGQARKPLTEGLPPLTNSAREIGTLRGEMAIGLGQLITVIPRPNDGVVAAIETELAAATDRIAVRVSHTGMLFSGAVARQVDAFLQTGRFHH